MRVKARRRLAGAVALVLAAVIVLPMLLDGEPKPIPASVEVRVPDRNSPFNPTLTATSPSDSVVRGTVQPAQGAATESSDRSESLTANAAADTTNGTANGTAPSTQSQDGTASATSEAGTSTAAQTTDPIPATDTKPVPPPPAQTTPTAPASRTDDGSRAIALLEGRAPTAGAAAAPGGSGLVVQVASYSTQADANARRDKLRSEGVTNAFVESTTVNGKPTFRLRVGPFSSRDAAQAAQTRLRSLGYPTGFIATQ